MSEDSIAVMDRAYARTRDCFDQMKAVEDILKRLADSFTEVNIAADFLHIQTDPKSLGPELQLTCLIKERIAAIQEQVTELYHAMNRTPRPVPC